MDLLRAGGQKIRIQTRCNPMFYDPDDPDPDDKEYEEDEHVPFYERDRIETFNKNTLNRHPFLL